ncbi:MAG: hypothetical protein AAGC78_07485 [Cellvibrio sp.]|uniref:hypothetical protein n=1 Tax=Cellvibrio sp. TaxID=1965322 RepID=UPI0031A521F9
MDLATRVKLKNSELLVQGLALQQQIEARVEVPGFRSFLVTFIVAPFIMGAAIRLLPGNTGMKARYVLRIIFPELRRWTLF